MGQATVATIEKILLPFAKDIRAEEVEIQGFDFTPRPWREALGPDQDLEAALDRFGSRVTRGDLFELARECAKSPDHVPLHRQAFFGVMLWGYGRATRWGPGRVARILAAQQFDDLLLSIQPDLAEGRLEEAYRRLRLPELGPPFLTKVLYFLGSAYRDRHSVPLIIDQFVAATLDWLFGSGNYFRWGGKSLAHDPVRYVRYVEAMHGWSKALECEPDQLEMFLWKQRENGPLWRAALSEA
jgi:hypothetical protein